MAPRGRLLSGAEHENAVLVEVSGLVCEQICVQRVRGSLAGLAGVESARHLPGTNKFRLVLSGEHNLSGSQVDRAVSRVVALRFLRRWLEKVATAIGITTAGAGETDASAI